MGITEVRSVIQRDGMTAELRNSLWNILDEKVWKAKGFMYRPNNEADIEPFSRVLWSDFYKLPVDERPKRTDQILRAIRGHFFDADWFEVFDFVEFCLWITQIERFRDLPDQINSVLERELSGYRVIDNQFVPVTDENEIAAIEKAIAESPYQGARTHLSQALRHLGNKQNPDYRNSIKESVSAVESACRELTDNPKATLGDALKLLQRSGRLHAALQAGFSALYGYTSDEQGIRHAMMQEPQLTQADAKYFLVSCAAFVNYLAEKNALLT
jgi:hypothetical protein